MRAGSLKPEYGLFEVANREQGPVPLRIGADAGKKLSRQRADNFPLREIGILRFVDQYMIGALVELVADPRRHIAFLQQSGGHPDHVVKVDNAVQFLCRGIAMVEGAACVQRACEQVGIFEQDRFFEQAIAPFEQRSGDKVIIRQGFQEPLGRLGRRSGGLGGPGQMDIRQCRCALLRIERQPKPDFQLAFLLLLATGFRHRIAQYRHRAKVYRFIGAAFGQPRRRVTFDRQSQQSPGERQYAGWEVFHCIGLGGTGHQKLFGRLFTHPDAEMLDRIDDLRTRRPFFLEQQITQSLARQDFLVARLDRLEHRGNTGLFGERSEQGLAEAVDRHDPQTATLCIEDMGK